MPIVNDNKLVRIGSGLFLCRGAARSALYDVESGDVYSINTAFANAIEESRSNINFQKAVVAHLLKTAPAVAHRIVLSKKTEPLYFSDSEHPETL